jgi:protein tyrosine/serine phosphatase
VAATTAARAGFLRPIVQGVLLGLAVSGAVLLGNMFFNTNLHVVIPGHVYRSSQVSEASLERFVRRFGIRTVINLRGYCAGHDWYAEECRACSRLDLSQEDFAFSAGHLPCVWEVRRLVDLLDRTEYPILFHCFRGVDRTGMATVIVLLLKTDTPLDEALRSLALRHLHLPFGRTGHLDRFFDFYEDWLEENGWEHAPARFRHWVMHEYRGGLNTGRMELLGEVLVGPECKLLPAPAGEAPPRPNARRTVRLPRDVPAGIPVRFHNTSPAEWVFHPSDNAGVHAFCRILDGEGRTTHLSRAGRFHACVAPGQSIDLLLTVPPLPKGKYHAQIGMLDEQHCFFQEVGLELMSLKLEVP